MPKKKTLSELLEHQRWLIKATENKYKNIPPEQTTLKKNMKHHLECSENLLQIITDAIYQRNNNEDIFLVNQLAKLS